MKTSNVDGRPEEDSKSTQVVIKTEPRTEEKLDDVNRNICKEHTMPKIYFSAKYDSLLCKQCQMKDPSDTQKSVQVIGEELLAAVEAHHSALKIILSRVKKTYKRLEAYSTQTKQVPIEVVRGIKKMTIAIAGQLWLFIDEANELRENLADALGSGDFYYVFIKRFAKQRVSAHKKYIRLILRVLATPPAHLSHLVKKMSLVMHTINARFGLIGGGKSRKVDTLLYCTVQNSVYIGFYDPRGAQIPARTRLELKSQNAAVTICGDSVFVSGGLPDMTQFLEYKMSTDETKRRVEMLAGRHSHALVCVGSAFLYAVGGEGQTPALGCQRYSLLSGRWQSTVSLASEYTVTKAVVVNERYIYIFKAFRYAVLDTLDEEAGWKEFAWVAKGVPGSPVQCSPTGLLLLLGKAPGTYQAFNVRTGKAHDTEIVADNVEAAGAPAVADGTLYLPVGEGNCVLRRTLLHRYTLCV